MDPSKVNIPPMKDLTVDNITENTIRINSLCEDPRMKYVLERLVSHLHDFARETRLSSKEWMAGLRFLTETGQICSDVRQVCTNNLEGISWLYMQRSVSDKVMVMTGIHPPLRRPRPLNPSRLNRPPQTPRFNRRHSPRSLPHARSRRNACGRSNVARYRR